MKNSEASRRRKWRAQTRSFCFVMVWIVGTGLAGAQGDRNLGSCPVVVRDSHGNVVRGLQPEDFESSLPIISVARDFRQRRIAIVLDASASMLADPVTGDWKLVKDIVSQLAEQGGEGTRLGLVIFNSERTDTVDFSMGKASVLARIQSISSDDRYKEKNCQECRTPLYDALYKGISLFSSPPQADALFVITDAEDNASKTSYKKLTDSLLASDVRLFAVVISHRLPYRSKTAEELLKSTIDLHFVVDKSGGSLFGPMQWIPERHLFHVVPFTENTSLSEELARFYRGIFDSDLISVRLADNCQQDCRWSLRLSKTSRKKVRGTHVEYPARLTFRQPTQN